MRFQPDGRILLGGEFTSVNNVPRPGLARLYAPGVQSVFEFVCDSFAFSEGCGSALITVQRLGDTCGSAEVHFATAPGTATDGADYLGQNGVLRFGPLEAKKQFSVILHDDGLAELTETVTLLLTEAAGVSWIGTPRAELRICDNDRAGSLDPSFHPALCAVNDPWWGWIYGSVSELFALPDGRVVVEGDLFFPADAEGDNFWANRRTMARLNADGSWDRTFDAPTTVNNVLAQLSDGGWLVRADNGLRRLRVDGAEDPGFSVPLDWQVNRLLVQDDGRLVLLGGYESGGNRYGRVQRLQADGTVDSSFAEVVFSVPGGWCDVTSGLVLPDGRILVGGNFAWVNGKPRNSLVCLQPDGTVDDQWQMPPTISGRVDTLLRQPDGRIVLGGSLTVSRAGGYAYGIARLNGDGSLDSTFLRGAGACDEWGGQGAVSALARQSDGRLLVGGFFTQVHGVRRHGLARLNLDGTVDPDFDAGREIRFRYSSGYVEETWPQTMTLLPSGQVLVAGQFSEWDGLPAYLLARINAEFLTRFTSCLLRPGGTFCFRVSVQPGHTYALEVSEDLRNWTQVRVDTAMASTLEFDIEGVQTTPRLFFRVVRQP